jgi:AcrR family transcriptional regulator
VGLAYHRFGSKAGLVAAVVDRFHDALDRAIALDAAAFRDWPARERERTRRLVRFLAADPLAPVVLDKLAREPEVAAVDAERWGRVIRQGARNIAQGQRQGCVPADRDPALLAALVIGAVRHGVAEAIRGGRPIDAEALSDEIWTFLAGGMALRAAATGG